jgi:hypothetical protein
MYYFQIEGDPAWYKHVYTPSRPAKVRNILWHVGGNYFKVEKYVPRDKTRLTEQEQAWIMLAAQDYNPPIT